MLLFILPAVFFTLQGCGNKSSSETNHSNSDVILNEEETTTSTIPPSASETVKNSYAKLVQFDALMDRKMAAFDAVVDYESRVCPPTSLILDGEYCDIEWNFFKRGSGTFLHHACEDRLVVKVQSPPLLSVMEGLWREEAASLVLSDSVLFPTVFHPDYSKGEYYVTDLCELQLLVTPYVDGFSLEESLYMFGPEKPEIVVQMAVRLIDIFEIVHRAGLVHGDVHMGNVLCSDGDDMPGSLHLIDFGRSRPFIDGKTGEVLTKMVVDIPLMDLNLSMLSIWELENSGALSPRDDLFRLAEMLIELHSGYSATAPSSPIPREQAKMKRLRDLSKYPDSFANFYKATMETPFGQLPDYNVLRAYFL